MTHHRFHQGDVAAMQPGDATAGRLGGEARGGVVQVVVEHGFVIRPRALAEEVGGLVSYVSGRNPRLASVSSGVPMFHVNLCRFPDPG